jgi:hypothetical protein
MWIYKLVDMEFWIPDFDRAEIYNRLKGFYNHVLGTAGMHSVQTNDLALKSDIDQIRSALKGGQCKLYILSKKGQEHLVLEYANIKNEVPDTRRLKAHFFSQRRFYLLPSPDQFIFFKNEMTKKAVTKRIKANLSRIILCCKSYITITIETEDMTVSKIQSNMANSTDEYVKIFLNT